MTVTEINNEFDIYYNNIASQSAPGLDKYEKSVYLTKAQLEVIKNKVNSNGNKYKKGFEGSEKRIVDLEQLVKDYKTSEIVQGNNISQTSTFFKLPLDLFLIVFEEIIFDTEKECLKNKRVKVVPKTHDEYNNQINNPFRKPSEDEVWRLRISNQKNNRVVELESSIKLKEYHNRYIKYPSPIVLTNLDSGEFTGQGLSIDGIINAQTCTLDNNITREIIDRAVELAVSDYKVGDLQAKVQLGARNE